TQDIYPDCQNQHSLDESFDAFWSVYPRREGKADARKAWRKINPNSDMMETIGNALRAQMENNWRGRSKQFIPLPATWLRGERWEDDINRYQGSDQPQENHQPPSPMYYDKKGGYTAEGLAAKARGELV